MALGLTMGVEIISIGTVAISAIGLATLIITKSFNQSANWRKAFEKHTEALVEDAKAKTKLAVSVDASTKVTEELKIYLIRKNGSS